MNQATALVEFYRARLDEAERIARAALAVAPTPWTRVYDEDGDGRWLDIHAANDETVVETESGANGPSVPIAEHIFHNDPARLLRQVEAGRETIRLYEDTLAMIEMLEGQGRSADGHKIAAESYLNVLRRAATIYADHPEYEEIA